MKRQVRRGVFETNSSSVHSITMCSGEEYHKWRNDEVLFWGRKNKFGTKQEIINELKNEKWYDGTPRYQNTDWSDEDSIYDIFSDKQVCTYDEFFENDDFETFSEEYITPNGEKVVAFGYYGEDR